MSVLFVCFTADAPRQGANSLSKQMKLPTLANESDCGQVELTDVFCSRSAQTGSLCVSVYVNVGNWRAVVSIGDINIEWRASR